MVKMNSIFYLMFFFLFLLVPTAFSQSNLEYKNRGNRYEGIKMKPVSNYNIELISARVDYTERINLVPDKFKIKFYLSETVEVHLVVRELDYKHYYWLDKVRPTKAWHKGFENKFVWPTHVVVQQLKGLRMYDLGTVVRLKRSEPSKIEEVAPAIFYHHQIPETVQGYLFTFKTRSDARFICSVYKEGQTQPIFSLPFPRQRGNRPFTVRWNSEKAADGLFYLVIKGYFLDTNEPLDQSVRFYHRRNVEK